MKKLNCIWALILCLALLMSACSAAPAPTPTAAAPTAAPAAAPAAQETTDESGGTRLWPDPGIAGNLKEQPRIQDDIAGDLNYDWYTNAAIPEGYSSWTSFNTLEMDVKSRLIETLKAPDDSADQQKAAAVFASAIDKDARDAAGLGPIRGTLDALLAVGSIEELNRLLTEDPLLFYFTPVIVLNISADLKNSSVYVTQIFAPSLSLGDSAEYTELTEQGARLKAANDTYYKALLTHNGVSEAEADAMTAAAFELETELAKGIYPVATSYQDDYYELTYNEYTPEDYFALAPGLPYQDILQAVGLGGATRFIVTEPEAIKTFNACYTEERLPGIKAYLAMMLLNNVSSYCDTFSEDAAIEWSNAVYGSSGRTPDEERAYALCDGLMGELVGKIYAEKYFDKSSKADIEDMVREVFDVYKQRLTAADWLGEKTRQTAIEKLETMTLRIGYPEVFCYDWDRVQLSAERPLIENVTNVIIEISEQSHAWADQPVNRELWDMSANTVNAYYNPSDNSINFPAAILNPPFYTAGGSRSQNLGGIGAVIAHEITHAFDTAGSQFDKDGNMLNWWTDADRAAFKARTDKVAAYYGSIEVLPGEFVHGDLTIGETVADLAAMASTLDILRTMEDADYEAYFASWVNIWAQLITPEMRSYFLKYDPHAPNYLRADVTVQQFPEFYETYGVKEGDLMYLAPEQRLEVW